MTVSDTGTVVLTGPTRGLGRETALALAGRPAGRTPDLLLIGRPGDALDDVCAQARAAGATTVGVQCDLASLASVRDAAGAVRHAVTSGRVHPLRAVVANAGLQSTDIRRASTEGYELTFAVNHLAHFLLLRELDDLLDGHARVVLVGSGTHRGGAFQRALGVPDARWEEPRLLATPGRLSGSGGENDVVRPARRAYSTSKLATVYFAHELQRRVGNRADVAVFDPGLMPGTGLARNAPSSVRWIWHTLMKGLRVLPGVSSPRRSGRNLADVAVDARWTGLRDGAYVEIDRQSTAAPHAIDRAREADLWNTSELLVATRLGNAA
jgi:NAD(P)-dependent dehydrogenase (short-subunit alcohol dehydrogenase family)